MILSSFLYQCDSNPPLHNKSRCLCHKVATPKCADTVLTTEQCVVLFYDTHLVIVKFNYKSLKYILQKLPRMVTMYPFLIPCSQSVPYRPLFAINVQLFLIFRCNTREDIVTEDFDWVWFKNYLAMTFGKFIANKSHFDRDIVTTCEKKK